MDEVDRAKPQPIHPVEQVRLSTDELFDLLGVERFMRDTDPRFVNRFETTVRRGRAPRQWHPFRR